MDRLQTFEAVKKDPTNLPSEIKTRFPEYCEIVTRMLSPIPEHRPTAKELLTKSIFLKRSKRELQNLIKEKDAKILELEARVSVGFRKWFVD